MQVLIWIVRIIVILLIVWFAARNAEPVVLYGYLDSSIRAPLVLILLGFFAGGLLIGLLASLMTIFQLKREVRKLNRAIQQKAPAASATLPPASGNANNV